MKDKMGRIGGMDWTHSRSEHVTGIYNANYSDVTGTRYGDFPKPWVVAGLKVSGRFHTHAEALQYAIKEAEARR